MQPARPADNAPKLNQIARLAAKAEPATDVTAFQPHRYGKANSFRLPTRRNPLANGMPITNPRGTNNRTLIKIRSANGKGDIAGTSTG
jgi:hypothetical protein